MIILITYDLQKNGNYNDLYATLKSADSWWHYLDSTWLILTDESPGVWSKKIRKVINNNDKFFIVDITGQERNGWLPTKAWDWIRAWE